MSGSSTARDFVRRLDEYPRVGLGDQGLTGLLDDGVVIVDAARRIHTVNPAAERLLGYSQAQLRGQPVDRCIKVMDENTGRLVADPLSRCVSSGEVVPFGNHDLLITRAGEIPVAGLASPVRGSRGGTIGVVLTLRDATPTRLLMRHLTRRNRSADRDPLVDLAVLEARVGHALEAADGHGADCHALLFLVLKGDGGSELRLDDQWREILEHTLREQDCMARLGRHGLAIFLERCSRAQAEWIARRLQERFNEAVGRRRGGRSQRRVEISVYPIGAPAEAVPGHRSSTRREALSRTLGCHED